MWRLFPSLRQLRSLTKNLLSSKLMSQRFGFPQFFLQNFHVKCTLQHSTQFIYLATLGAIRISLSRPERQDLCGSLWRHLSLVTFVHVDDNENSNCSTIVLGIHSLINGTYRVTNHLNHLEALRVSTVAVVDFQPVNLNRFWLGLIGSAGPFSKRKSPLNIPSQHKFECFCLKGSSNVYRTA